MTNSNKQPASDTELDEILDWHSRCRKEIKAAIPGYARPEWAEEQYDGIVRRHKNQARQAITAHINKQMSEMLDRIEAMSKPLTAIDNERKRLGGQR